MSDERRHQAHVTDGETTISITQLQTQTEALDDDQRDAVEDGEAAELLEQLLRHIDQ